MREQLLIESVTSFPIHVPCQTTLSVLISSNTKIIFVWKLNVRIIRLDGYFFDDFAFILNDIAYKKKGDSEKVARLSTERLIRLNVLWRSFQGYTRIHPQKMSLFIVIIPLQSKFHHQRRREDNWNLISYLMWDSTSERMILKLIWNVCWFNDNVLVFI